MTNILLSFTSIERIYNEKKRSASNRDGVMNGNNGNVEVSSILSAILGLSTLTCPLGNTSSNSLHLSLNNICCMLHIININYINPYVQDNKSLTVDISTCNDLLSNILHIILNHIKLIFTTEENQIYNSDYMTYCDMNDNNKDMEEFISVDNNLHSDRLFKMDSIDEYIHDVNITYNDLIILCYNICTYLQTKQQIYSQNINSTSKIIFTNNIMLLSIMIMLYKIMQCAICQYDQSTDKNTNNEFKGHLKKFIDCCNEWKRFKFYQKNKYMIEFQKV
jgi:hypothetical protein